MIEAEVTKHDDEAFRRNVTNWVRTDYSSSHREPGGRNGCRKRCRAGVEATRAVPRLEEISRSTSTERRDLVSAAL